MLRVITFIVFICLAQTSVAQGSWNIGYLPVDSIDKSHIGRFVRIDLKHKNFKVRSSATRSVRSYIITTDTGMITLDTTRVQLAERRIIYVDHGSYDDQFLECVNCKEMTMRFYDAQVLEVDEKSILFRIVTETDNKNGERPEVVLKIVRIEREMLDGVMYKL